MHKIWAIAWKDIYGRFTDRTLLVITILTPLALSTIVGLAFGGLPGEGADLEPIPTAVLQLDTSSDSAINFGDLVASVLAGEDASSLAGARELPSCGSPEGPNGQNTQSDGTSQEIRELVAATTLDQALVEYLVDSGRIQTPQAAPGTDAYLEEALIASIAAGEFDAGVLIPKAFSAGLMGNSDPTTEGETRITVFASAGNPVSGSVIHSVVQGIVYRIAAGTTAISATMTELGDGLTTGPVSSSETSQALAGAFACGFTLEADTIQTIERTLSERQDVSTRTIILVSVGSAQAMFFALFTAQFGILSLYAERRNWTLQRLLVSPTPASSILSGKLVGVFISVLFQLLLLFASLTLVGSILEGELVLIWGGNPLATGVVLIAISFAVAGFGMLLAGIVRSPEQGQIFASILNISLAAMGGAFGFNFPEPIARLSLIYWGKDALQQLAIGNTDVLLNVVVLLLTGVIMFIVGLILFRRRFKTL